MQLQKSRERKGKERKGRQRKGKERKGKGRKDGRMEQKIECKINVNQRKDEKQNNAQKCG